jgi:hypothetical protein
MIEWLRRMLYRFFRERRPTPEQRRIMREHWLSRKGR